MTPKFTLGLVLALVPATLSAQPSAPDSALRSAGKGQYEVLCKLTMKAGDDGVRNLIPGRETIGLKAIQRAECDYKIGAGGPVTLTLSGAEWQCPFPANPSGACEVTFAKSAFGNFNLRRKSH